MKNKLSLILLSALFLVSCTANSSTSINTSNSSSSCSTVSSVNSSSKSNTSISSSITSSSSLTTNSSSSKVSSSSIVIPSASNNPSYDETQDIVINLNNDEINVTNNNGFVIVESERVWVLKGGVYILKGEMAGQIIVNAPDEEVELDFSGVAISSDKYCPVLILDADECDISAKKGTKNTVIDNREDDTDYAAAIYSTCDLTLKGKGNLTVTNNFNNGIHTKDDLKIKNLTLNVTAKNNALKGNDSLTLESANLTAISKQGDALKTKNTDISSKGNQRGTITIDGGTLNLYAATDAIDASYDVIIDGNPEIYCYTNKYSEYSEEIESTFKDTLYLKIDRQLAGKSFYVLFTMEDGSEKFVELKDYSVGFDRNTYYNFSVLNNAKYITVYVYNSTTSSLDDNYLYKSEKLTINQELDCLNLSLRNASLNTSWSQYRGNSGNFGLGGNHFEDGNAEKSTYSNKGIKADNNIEIKSGKIFIKSHDDAIHANGDEELENGEKGLGNITISGGELTLYSDDDAVHADYNLTISGGNINVTNSYEGFEANIITINGGTNQIVSSDDAINATYFKEEPMINFDGGITYLNAEGDGIDSNGSVSLTGGYVLAIGPSNGGNGVLDYDHNFVATGGYLLAIGASGMDQGISASGNAKSSTQKIKTSSGQYLSLIVDNETIIEFKIPKNRLNYCVYSYVGNTATVNLNNEAITTIGENLYFVLEK